jgi:hypothetical protein
MESRSKVKVDLVDLEQPQMDILDMLDKDMEMDMTVVVGYHRA